MLLNKIQVDKLVLGLAVIIITAPYVWNYAVQSAVVVNVIISTIVLYRVLTTFAGSAAGTAVRLMEDYQTRPKK